ncbi:MAG: hypothetical protein N2255_05110 [Kiritimatiellae bacterium]|nr:hypothetical protein [Kiritimatiellia bacterium]
MPHKGHKQVAMGWTVRPCRIRGVPLFLAVGKEAHIDRQGGAWPRLGTYYRCDFTVRLPLVPGVPGTAPLLFEGVALDSRAVPLLEIRCEDSRGRKFFAQLRNIPVEEAARGH